MKSQLDKIFQPKTIAVIGASNEPKTIGSVLMSNLVGKRYKGIVFPVNPKETSIQGVKCYPKVGNISDPVDLAIIATPAATVLKVLEDCGKAGIKGVVIISAGFKEVGEAGMAMSQKLIDILRRYDMRAIGPNCLGFINPNLNLNASFANTMALPGRIAFISQSGALCTSILEWARERKVGFSHFVSIGDMIDIGFHDLIDYFGSATNTASILIYMEALSDARKFMSAARAFARNKPIIVLKAGRSREGAKATLSHTGSLAGNDDAFDAAFKRAGVIRVETISQLFDSAQALDLQKRPRGNRLAIITNAGGPGVLATDHLIQNGGALAQFSKETIGQLNQCLPPTWSHGNPVDLVGDATPERFRQAVEICLKDQNTDGILIILTPQALTTAAEVRQELAPLVRRSNKTILASWMGEEKVAFLHNAVEKASIPSYPFPENAVDVFLKMYSYTRNIELLYETPYNIPKDFTPDVEASRKLLNGALKAGRKQLTEVEAKQLLSYYEMPVTKPQMANSPEEAVRLARKIKFPVVLKVVSPDIGLKTDIGGVMLNLKSAAEVEKAYDQILQSVSRAQPEARVFGVSVEKMINKRYELLIGAKKDPIFGPVIVFGRGGVTVEVFQDLSFELPPLNMALARRVIKGTKVNQLLKGFRGMPKADIRDIQFMLYKFAYLIIDCPQIKEIDINPMVVDENGSLVLDAYVILDQSYTPKTSRPYSHLVISPYPKHYEKRFTLTDGRVALLRPIRPEDEPLEAAMFNHLSKQTQYFRFFGFVPNVSKELLKRSTQIDYDREIAIIAEIEEDGHKRMLGEVRLLADSDHETAEFAIVVADPWQGLGLGNQFMDYVIKIGKEMGIRKINASVLKANRIMVYMFRKRGFSMKSLDHSTFYVELSLADSLVKD